MFHIFRIFTLFFFLNTVFAVNGQSFVILLLSGLMNIHRSFVRIEEIHFVLRPRCRFILRPHQSESNPFV